MRRLVFIFALAVFGSGCATYPPKLTTAEVRQKRYEAQALEAELAVLTRQLDKVEKMLAEVPESCPLDAQASALDRRIAIARKAKAAVTAEYEFMINRYLRGF